MSSSDSKGFFSHDSKGDKSSRVHISFLAGIRVIQQDRDPEKYSGYQVRDRPKMST